VARVSVSRQARRNLIEIWKYVAKDSVRHADRLHERFYEVFSLLGRQPEIGIDSSEIKQGTRKFPVDNYIIYYKITQRGIQVLHVFHGKQNQRKALRRQ
jgi:plasmid stabilization system protein ParE